MPHRDCVGTDDLHDIANHLFGRPKRLPTREDINLAKLREQIRIDMAYSVECARLKEAKQVLFSFAEPGEDWGSL
jgi:hypothetical protein